MDDVFIQDVVAGVMLSLFTVVVVHYARIGISHLIEKMTPRKRSKEERIKTIRAAFPGSHEGI